MRMVKTPIFEQVILRSIFTNAIENQMFKK